MINGDTAVKFWEIGPRNDLVWNRNSARTGSATTWHSEIGNRKFKPRASLGAKILLPKTEGQTNLWLGGTQVFVSPLKSV